RVVPTGGLHQPDIGDLTQILHVPGPGDEPPRDRLRQGKVGDHALVRPRTCGERPCAKALHSGHEEPHFYRRSCPGRSRASRNHRFCSPSTPLPRGEESVRRGQWFRNAFPHRSASFATARPRGIAREGSSAGATSISTQAAPRILSSPPPRLLSSP